jgi:hypothetical protein
MRSEADVPKGHERVGSMNIDLQGSTTPKKPGQGGSASGSGIPDDEAGTSSGIPTLQGAVGIGPGGRTPRQMTYVIGSQSQVPRSPTKSPPGGRRVPGSGEGGYPDTPGKRLSPLIYSDDEAAQQSELEGMGCGGGPPGPSGGGGEPSSSARMRIDFERQPNSEPPIFRDGDTFFDGLTGPMVTSQGENSAIFRRTVMRGEQEEHTSSIPRGVGWQPILGQDFAAARTSVVYCDVKERNRVAMSCHRHNVASHHYDGSRRCYYSGVN